MKLLLIDCGSPIAKTLEEKAKSHNHTFTCLSKQETLQLAAKEDDENKKHPLEGYDAVFYLPGEANEQELKDGKALINAFYKHRAHRFLTLSQLGAHDPEAATEDHKAALRHHHELDKELKFSGIDYTILRTGTLTKDPGTGKIQAVKELKERNQALPAEDAAEALLTCLKHHQTENKVIEIAPGDQPIEKALTDIPLT